MELFSPEFFTALISIIIIDLMLAGDNAIVIGLSARNLPKGKQKKVIFWGMAGAVVMRILCTLIVVWLLRIPGLLLIGGVILVWIAFRLLVEEKGDKDVEAASSVWSAIRTIVVADTVMGLDNVLAVAGAAHNSFLLVVIGLLISVPIIIWGSTLFIKLLEKYPFILYIGSGVLVFTAAKMIADEKLIQPLFQDAEWLKYGFYIVLIAIVLYVGHIVKTRKEVANV
ncbi:MAG: TerC family protein [Thermoactinomyces sp.]